MKEHKVFKPTGAKEGRVEDPARRPMRDRVMETRNASSRDLAVAGTASAALSPQRRGPHKAPGVNVRKDYGLTVEVGFILALLALIGVFHMRIQYAEEFETTAMQQEVVQMEEILQTEQVQKPPPPPRPQLPIVVADDVILDDVDLNLDAALDIGQPLEALPPPPPPEEPEEVVEEVEEEIFVVVEQMPELIGGIESLQKKIQYPEIARQAGVIGRVFIQFIVDTNGNVTNPVVLRGIGGGCDEEALRVIKQAKFTPGKQRGKPVKVRYVIPIVFKLK